MEKKRFQINLFRIENQQLVISNKKYSMEHIFNKTGYNIRKSSSNPADDKIILLQINNPDGTPRWIWNAKNKKPMFLKFYNISSCRAFLFATIIKLVFVLKLQKLVFNKQKFFIKKSNFVFKSSTFSLIDI